MQITEKLYFNLFKSYFSEYHTSDLMHQMIFCSLYWVSIRRERVNESSWCPWALINIRPAQVIDPKLRTHVLVQ